MAQRTRPVGYDAIAGRVFVLLMVDGYMFEHETSRATDFAPLRLLAKDTIAVLSRIITKVVQLKSKDALKRRIGEAAQVLDLKHPWGLACSRVWRASTAATAWASACRSAS